MIRMQDENTIHCAGEHWIWNVILAGYRKAHMQEVGREIEIVLRVNEWLADVIFVGHGGKGRDLGNHADRSDHALMRIRNVRRVVIER